MADSDKQVSYGVSADASGFEQGMQRAADGARGAASSIEGNFKKVQGAFSEVQKQLLVLAGLVAGGAFFKEAIAESNRLTGETMKLARALGINSTEASALNTALGDIGSSGDEYVETFTKFARQLKSNEDGLKSYGIQTRDANGNLRDSRELFEESLKTVGQYKAGLDQNTYAQTVFGKSIDNVMKLQKLNNEVIEEAKKKNQELGLVVTQENVEASKRYKLAMNDVGDVLTAVKKTIGDAVMPAFSEMGEYLASTGPYVVQIFKGALLGLLVVFQTVKAAVKSVAVIIFETINQAVDIAGLLGDMFVKLVKADYSGVAEAGRKIGDRLKQGFVNAFDGVSDAVKDGASAVGEDFQRIYGQGKPAAQVKSGSKRMGEFRDTKDTSRVSGWDAELSEAKLAFQEQQNTAGTFYTFTKAQELAFWREKLAITVAGTAENLAVRKKVAELQLAIGQEVYAHELAALSAQEANFKQNLAARLGLVEQQAALVRQRYGTESKEYEEVQKRILEIKRQAVEQQKQVDMTRAEATRQAQLAELNLAREQAQLDRDLRVISNAELLDLMRGFEEQRYRIQLEALKERERLALADPDRNPVELAKLHQEIQAAEQQHQQRLGEIKGQSAREQSRYITGTYDAIQSGWASVIAKTMQGGMTVAGFLRGMFQAVVQAVIQSLAQLAAQWLMQMLLKRIIGKTTAAGEIAGHAGVAGAGAYAATAAIPFIGPALAPAAAATAFAGAMAYQGALLSAAGGYDIPGNVNPIVQTHANEMILPAKHADVIRRMSDEEGGGRQAADQAAIELRVAKLPGNFFAMHRDEFLKMLNGAKRDFAWK